MSLIGGGGDHGGTGEDPTHPKPSAGDKIVLARMERCLAIMGREETLDSNWDGAPTEGKNTGLEARLAGEIDLEDEFCMEEEAEVDVPPAQPKVWRMLARYYSLKPANFTLIHSHFSEKKQTKEYGELIGSKLGKVVKVDVDAEGLELSEYLRVRIDWPLDQRLLARFKTTITGQPIPRIYQMRYVHVPYFCFHCGFIGHNEEQCEQKVLGTRSLQYNATLRCSPKRKFQSRAVATPDEPAAKKSLRFSTPKGSVSSSSLGIPTKQARVINNPTAFPSTELPQDVDAHDGFEEDGHRTEDAVETDLANTVNNMRLKLAKDNIAPDNHDVGRGKHGMPGTPQFVPGSSSGTAEVALAPGTMEIMQHVTLHPSGGREALSGPHSSDMIPALRGLSQLDVSQGSGSDVSMTLADTVLGKRPPEDDDAPGQKLDLSLTLNSIALGGKQKKGKKGGDEAYEEKKDTSADSVATRTRRKIKTGHGASGNGSSTWHAIEYGLELLKQGVIWRVGNDITKGKMVVDHNRGFKKDSKPDEDRKKVKMKWIPPGDNEFYVICDLLL
ncbi:hypothetical protein ACQ4PT_011005 [Festuca glaucescens]